MVSSSIVPLWCLLIQLLCSGFMSTGSTGSVYRSDQSLASFFNDPLLLPLRLLHISIRSASPPLSMPPVSPLTSVFYLGADGRTADDLAVLAAVRVRDAPARAAECLPLVAVLDAIGHAAADALALCQCGLRGGSGEDEGWGDG